jgi:CRP-like cAMP-binding protein
MTEISHDKLARLMRDADLLKSASDHEIELLAACARQVRYHAGENVFTRHDEGRDLMFLAEGRIKISSTAPSGVHMLFGLIEAGEFFGETSMLDGETRAADAVAATDCMIASIPRADFMEFLGRNPRAAIALGRMICGRLRQLAAYVEDAVLLDSRMRLLNRLKSLAQTYGARLSSSPGIRIEHRLSQEELAETVGLTRVSVNRHLRRWYADGLIDYGRGYVLIYDLDRLEAAVENELTQS